MSQTSPSRTGGRDRNVAIATLPSHRSELATLDLDQLLSVELIRGQELSGNKITNSYQCPSVSSVQTSDYTIIIRPP